MNFHLCGCFLRCCRLFRSWLALLFFLRFWFILGDASPWAGSEFTRLWWYLPHRWSAVDSPYSSWLSRSSFWRSDFYALFHSSRTIPWFSDFVSSPPSLYVLSFRYSFHQCLHLWWLSLSPCLPLKVWIVIYSMYALWAYKVVSGLKLNFWFLGAYLPFSLPEVVSLHLLFPLV